MERERAREALTKFLGSSVHLCALCGLRFSPLLNQSFPESQKLKVESGEPKASSDRLIHRPVIRDSNFPKIRIGVDRERMLRNRQHLPIPNCVAERAIGRNVDRGLDRLHLARSTWYPHQAICNHAL